MIDFAYQVRWKPRAIRDMKRLPERDSRRVFAAIERFARTNEGDVKNLSGVYPPEQRLRVGDYRVRFSLNKPAKIMTILRVLPRGKAYRIRESESRYSSDALEAGVA